MRTPDVLIIPGLIVSEIWRKTARRLRSKSLPNWRFSNSQPKSILLTPEDLAPANPDLANTIYAGEYTFQGTTHRYDNQSPFTAEVLNEEWFDALHGFAWLRHLRAANTDLFRSHASALVIDWIEAYGANTSNNVWRSDITATRLISWLKNSALLFQSTPRENKEIIMRSLVQTTRYLQKNERHMRNGYPRLRVTIALAFSALCLSDRDKTLRSATRDLDKALDRQILPDGGHISRNPAVLASLLTELLPLQQAYIQRGQAPSRSLISAIDRMQAALRFFRHADGSLAQFNGSGSNDQELLKIISKHYKTQSEPQHSMPRSGYERLMAETTVVLIDVGKPIDRTCAHHAMAGTLSFELSSDGCRFLTNCGVPETTKERYLPFARATAAHSTASIGNQSSSRFARAGGWQKYLPSPLLSMPKNVISKRVSRDNFDTVVASHDGYRPAFGTIHKRTLHLSDDGATLNGVDIFQNVTPGPSIVVRFHLPLHISASLLANGHSILLAGTNNTAWTFTCVDAAIALEESIQFSGVGGPRKSLQITVTPQVVEAVRNLEVRWVFSKRRKSAKQTKDNNSSASSDLLDMFAASDTSNTDGL